MPRHTLHVSTWLTALWLAAPAAQADNTATLDGWPDWVRDGMAAEAPRLKYREVKTPDDSVRARLPGKPPKPQAIEDGWYYTADIKSDTPVECYLFNSGRDLATFIDVIAEANIGAVSDSHGTVGNRRVFHTGAGEVAGMPYLALEWLYTVESESQRLVAFTKVRAAGKGDTAMACAHNHLGYRDTFAAVFAEFVSSVDAGDTTSAPFYEDISHIDINGIGPGVIYSTYSIDEDGDIRAELAESILLPVDPSTLMTNDSYAVSYSDAESGALISAHDITVENGEITGNMMLQRNDAGAWVSSGSMQGKKLEHEIDGALEPASEWQQLVVVRDLFAGDEKMASVLVWVPDADPTKFIEATIDRSDAASDREATLTIGPIRSTGRFDEAGHLVEADTSVGPVQMKMRRLWSQGTTKR